MTLPKLAGGSADRYKALYSCMLRPNGGIIDDLTVYRVGAEHFRLIVNAATRAKKLAWLAEQAAQFDVAVAERADLAMLAVQGVAAGIYRQAAVRSQRQG